MPGIVSRRTIVRWSRPITCRKTTQRPPCQTVYSIMALAGHGQVNLPHAQKRAPFPLLPCMFPCLAFPMVAYPLSCPLPGDGTAVSSHTRPPTANLEPFSVSMIPLTPTMNRQSNCGTHQPGLSGRASRHDLRPSLVTLCRCCHWPTPALVSTLGRSQHSSRTDSPGVPALPSGAWQRARTIGDGTPIASMWEPILRHRTLYCPVWKKSSSISSFHGLGVTTLLHVCLFAR